MLIECIIERDGLTHVNINGFPYTFEKNEYGHNVAPVNSWEHREWLLSFPARFRIYESPEAAPVEVDKEIPMETHDSESKEKANGDSKPANRARTKKSSG